MPVLDFGTLTTSLTFNAELGLTALARSLGQIPAISEVGTNLALAGLVRSTGALQCEGVFGWVADLKRLLKLGMAQGYGQVQTSIQFFLNAIPVAAPMGGLSLASINTLINPNVMPSGFAGQRFVRGDLIPIQFQIRGQRLAGLNAMFTACRASGPHGVPHDILKIAPGAIHQTEPVQDSNTQVEVMTGTFTLNPNDTSFLPDGEFEFIYEFKLTDGLGRVHTLESGRFKVHSICPVTNPINNPLIVP